MKRRRLVVLLGCLGVVAAMVLHDRFAAQRVAAVVGVTGTPVTGRDPARTAEPSGEVLAIASRGEYADAQGNVFVAPPPPKSVVAAVPVQSEPPPAPKAPQPPFTFVGKEFDAGVWKVFLAAQDNILIAREGELLGDDYKVLKIHPPTMEIVYLPLNEKQTFGIGAPHNE